MANGLLQLLEEALTRGKAEGKAEGEARVIEARRGDILSVLEARFGAVPETLHEPLARLDDPARLDALVRAAATAPSLDHFATALAAGDAV